MTSKHTDSDEFDFDVVVVGAGFSGLYALYKLRGEGHRVRVFEAASDVGGTWFFNRYPGARVDVESREYSFGFSEELENEWKWSELYSAQPELLRYAQHIADRFDLRRDIQFDTRVTAATFDAARNAWVVETDRGDRVVAHVMVMAAGNLSVPKDVDIPGIEAFKGEVYRASVWPAHEVSFTGKRVGIIGTGSSGVQIIPLVAEQADHLTVFQRTAVYSLPSRNGPMPEKVMREWLDNRVRYRKQQRDSFFGLVVTDVNPAKAGEVAEAERARIFEERWQQGGFSIIGSFSDLLVDEDANATVADFVRDKIRGVVKDPKVAARLMPTGYPIFTKRPSVDVGYYETYNRDNVELVDLKSTPIEAFTANAVRTGGKDHELDMLILAIGFDAMTGALNRIDIRGIGGRRLKDAWAQGPQTYLGLAMAGFPNMFLIIGPGSPSILGNQMASMEHNVGWVADCLAYLSKNGFGAIDATPEAQASWMQEVKDAADKTLYPRVESWYTGANVAGKPRGFMAYLGGWKPYLDRCDDCAAKGYEGFRLIPDQRTARAALRSAE